MTSLVSCPAANRRRVEYARVSCLECPAESYNVKESINRRSQKSLVRGPYTSRSIPCIRHLNTNISNWFGERIWWAHVPGSWNFQFCLACNCIVSTSSFRFLARTLQLLAPKHYLNLLRATLYFTPLQKGTQV